MSDPDGKERLTNAEFRELIPHLPLADLLLIEFRKEKWQKFISVADPSKKLYGCALCGISNSNAKNLNAHMEGKKHKINMNEVKQFYHPEYTYMKYQQRLAETGTSVGKNANKASKSQSNQSVTKDNTPKVGAVATPPAAKPLASTSKAAAPKGRPVPIVIKSAAGSVNGPKVSESKIKAVTKIAPVSTNKTVDTLKSNQPPSSKSNQTETNKLVEKIDDDVIVISEGINEEQTEDSSREILSKKENSSSVEEKGKSSSVEEENGKSSSVTEEKEKSSSAEEEKGKSISVEEEKGKSMPVEEEKGKSITVEEEKGKSCSVQEEIGKSSSVEEEKGKSSSVEEYKDKDKDKDNSSQSQSKTNDAKNKNSAEQPNLVKNPFAHANNADGQNKPRPKISVIATALLVEPRLLKPEVIVIDDEPPASDKDDTTMVGLKIPTIEKRVVSKPQSAQFPKPVSPATDISVGNLNKRPSEEFSANKVINLNEPQTKKQKIVVNPAAVFVNEQEHTGDTNEAPNYQKDKVIIPTVHKKDNQNQNQNQRPLNKRNEPKFSSKTFSSKPSDDDIHGLIGVEYVVKVMKTQSDKSPRYECSLCELILDGSSMQNHLVGYNHRMKFCEKHFPTAIAQYKQYCTNVKPYEVFKIMTPILGKLATAIEQHHGRDLPYECLESDFNANRHAILSKLFSCRHASEQNGPSFTHVVDSREIDEFISRKEFFKPQTGPSEPIFIQRPEPRKNFNQPFRRENRRENNVEPPRPPYGYNEYMVPVDDDIHKRMVEDFLRGTVRSRSPHRQHDRDRDRHSRRSRERQVRRSRSRSHSHSRTHSHSDKGYHRKSLSPLREGDIWQAYRHTVDRKINDLNEVFKLYHSDPETHPMYNEEWQKFWKRRKDELIAAGLDHRSYNYQPEWVRYFKVRIEELYAQAVENIKIQSRERLCLPMVNIYLSDPKYHVQMVEQPYGTNSAVDIYPNVRNNPSPTLPTHSQTTSTPEVVPVLRLMTALEEHLGSLGPKIIDLMSKALLEEKTNPSEANAIILTIENCTLLETAMEKLKGVLYAGLLDGAKERAFKKVITDTSNLLAFAEEERKKNPPKPNVVPQKFTNRPSYASTQPGRVPSTLSAPAPVPAPAAPMQSQASAIPKGPSSAISTLLAQMDKKELATKLAATLSAQGKTDFSSEQLEQLIAVYTLIEKKKREAAPNTTETVTRESAASTSSRTLSDTLANFMNPSNPNMAAVASLNQNSATGPVNANAYTAATVNRYLDQMRRGSGSFPKNSSDTNINDLLQNLQNIQRDLNASNVNPNQNLNIPQRQDDLWQNLQNIRRDMNATNANPNQNSNVQSSSLNMPQRNNFGIMNLNQLGFQTQNPYLNTTNQQKPYWQQDNPNYGRNMLGTGNLFTNTNNSSRMDTNNISINTTQQLQSLQRQETMNQPNPNQRWRENLNKNLNARGGGGVGGPMKNAGGKNKGGSGGGAGGGGGQQNKNRRKR